jgi:hypothetical protein
MEDSNADLSYKAHIAVKPLQELINVGLAADKYVNRALLGLSTGVQDAVSEAKAFKHNAFFCNGSYGRAAVAAYTTYITDFSGAHWGGVSGPVPTASYIYFFYY